MLTRLAIFGFMAAAVATLLDRGTLWDFTLDPERRLIMVAYWTVHALLLVFVVLAYRSVTTKTTPAALLTLLATATLSAVFCGLVVADIVVLIELAFMDDAPGVLAFIVIALLLRMIWRLVVDPSPLLIKSDDNAEQPRWADVLRSIAAVPLAVGGFYLLVTLLGLTWRTASLALEYTLLGRDPATLDWSYAARRVADFAVDWQILAFIAGAMILAIVMEKLFARSAKEPSGGS